MVTLELTDREVEYLRGLLVRGIWTESCIDAFWYEDSVEDAENGEVHGIITSAHLSRIVRKLVGAVRG